MAVTLDTVLNGQDDGADGDVPWCSCQRCQRELTYSAPKVAEGHGWLCPDCALLADNPDAAIAPPPPPAVPLKAYELFDSREFARR